MRTTDQLTPAETGEFVDHLIKNGEYNLMAYVAGLTPVMNPCPACGSLCVAVRSQWFPDLMKHPQAGEWGESEPCPPYYVECKCHPGTRGLSAEPSPAAVVLWHNQILEESA